MTMIPTTTNKSDRYKGFLVIRKDLSISSFVVGLMYVIAVLFLFSNSNASIANQAETDSIGKPIINLTDHLSNINLTGKSHWTT